MTFKDASRRQEFSSDVAKLMDYIRGESIKYGVKAFLSVLGSCRNMAEPWRGGPPTIKTTILHLMNQQSQNYAF